VARDRLMEKRPLGKSGLEVSPIAFGTGDNAGGIIFGSTAHQREMVERALELGITTFDCSPDYGKGMGEANLGRVLRDLGSPPVTVITKVEIMPEHFGRIRERVHESLADSLLRLGRSNVDVVLVHNPARERNDPSIRTWTPLTSAQILDEILPAFRELRAAGKVGHFGVSCEAAQTGAVRRVLASGEFAAVNAWFNITNPSAATPVDGLPERERYDGLFDAVAEVGAGVVVIRPLAGGSLTGPILERSHEGRHELSRGYLRDRRDVFSPEIERARRFAFLHRPGEQSISEAAYRFILADPRVSTLVGGFSEVAHMEEAVRAVSRGPLSPADTARIAELQRAVVL
jgi:aryl-alcohol dehydrogenase-like predicted oxidoreductase